MFRVEIHMVKCINYILLQIITISYTVSKGVLYLVSIVQPRFAVAHCQSNFATAHFLEVPYMSPKTTLLSSFYLFLNYVPCQTFIYCFFPFSILAQIFFYSPYKWFYFFILKNLQCFFMYISGLLIWLNTICASCCSPSFSGLFLKSTK